MNKNGFTVIEFLAVMVVISFLLIIGIPSYVKVYTTLRRDTHNNKVKLLEAAGEKYASSLKDDVKNHQLNTNTCLPVEISTLIQKGYIMSDDDYKDVIISPIDKKAFSGKVMMCYNFDEFEVLTYYVEELTGKSIVYKGEKVLVDDKVYSLNYDYNPIVTYNASINCEKQLDAVASGTGISSKNCRGNSFFTRLG